MEKKDKVQGAEGIVIHNNKIVLGMQKPKRWYKLENGEQAAIIKTIGGALEKQDKQDTRKTLIREFLEEIQNLKLSDIKMNKIPIFTKNIKMKDLNPYEKDSNLNMTADFYILEISKEIEIKPNDLPALLEIPIKKFLQINIAQNIKTAEIEDYIIKKENIKVPENFAIMAPVEIKNFFRCLEKEGIEK